jgi:energy-coupling factor transporter ATP-binding protein EcfA2
MDNFKIIAVKTGEKPKRTFEVLSTGVKLDYFKNLEPKTIYSFYSNYTFPLNDFKEILFEDSLDIDLYSLKSTNSNLAININAVVGNNGSGKSTLIELLYWANYNIGCTLKLLRAETRNKTLSPYKFIDLQILYSINKEELVNIIFKDGLIFKEYLKYSNEKYSPTGKIVPVVDGSDLSDFFYSIVVNYSHYALNSYEVGDWIIPLFHKNDGYQTPIVLNPMRTEGIIDINKENRLLMRRLQGNLLEQIDELKIEDSLRNIGNGKIVTGFRFKYNPQHYPFTPLEEPKDIKLTKLLVTAINKHFKIKITDEDINSNYFVNISINYIIEKLIKISKNYSPYKKYRDDKSIKYINSFIERIKNSNSHIIFKVKGAILYLKYYKFIFGDNFILSDQEYLIDINILSDKIKEIKERESSIFINTFIMAPPAFFNSEIILGDDTLFSALSSGEKQRIHSTSSIIYHIINLNSVKDDEVLEDNDINYYNYPYVNIILDEIELYYHPEWQRKYIHDLLDNISKITHENIKNIKGINISFLTHSPYILSDIPASNTLRLKKGKPQYSEKKEETFGSNIHNLLANDFFMDNGFMGEVAKTKIEETIIYLNFKIVEKNLNSGNENLDEFQDKNENESLRIKFLSLREKLKNDNKLYHKKVIDLIGEPIIKNKLQEMYYEVFNEEDKKNIKEEILIMAQKAGIDVKFND